MDNSMIAKKLAHICFSTQGRYGSDDFAVQLFVERTVLPKDCESYSEKEIEKYIYDYLESI